MPGSIYRSEAAREQIHALYDRAREALPFATTSRSVPTRFGEAHMLEAGPPDGPPVVVFQGGNVVNPLTLAWFAPLVDRFRIHAPDTIGQPGKSEGGPLSANDGSLGEWAIDVLDGLRRESAAVIGISYGAGVALRLATLAPDRIDRAVFVVPAGIADIPIPSMLSLAAGYIGYRVTSRRGLVEATVRRLTGGEPDPMFVESTALAFSGTALDTEMPRNATADDLRGLKAPVMVVVGERDPLFPPDRILPRAKEIFSDLVGAEILPACAHILSTGCAGVLAARIDPFLCRADPMVSA